MFFFLCANLPFLHISRNWLKFMTWVELQVYLKPFQLLKERVNKKGEWGEGVCRLYQTD